MEATRCPGVKKGGEDYGEAPVCPIGQFLRQVTNLAGRWIRREGKERMKKLDIVTFLRKLKTIYHEGHKGAQRQATDKKARAWFPSCTFVPLWSGT
jgi:hypothetical protein